MLMGDTMNKETIHNTSNTTILTDEDHQTFDGITIDEKGEEIHDEHITSQDANSKRTHYEYQNFKVYTVTPKSLLLKLAIAAILIAVIISIIIFGGIYLIGFAVVAIIGLIISLLTGLFF